MHSSKNVIHSYIRKRIKNLNSIYVQIASYRDPELIPTLDNLIKKSKMPSNLRIAVCWQHGTDETLPMFINAGYRELAKERIPKVNNYPVITLIKDEAIVELMDVNYYEARGACWARNQLNQLYDGEKYTLQLDSHHRFIKDWDTILIDMLENLRSKSKKPLLTAYLPSFNPQNDPAERIQAPWRMTFDRFIPQGPIFYLPETIPNFESLTEPVPSRFFSGHFCFADGSLITEVEYDPYLYFHGEEQSFAVRAYTAGYDLYHPHKVIAWHEYTRNGRNKNWDDHTNNAKKEGKIEKDWCERNIESHQRYRVLFGMDGEKPESIDFGKYGFGTERTLRDYEEYAGLSHKFRGISTETLNKTYPPNSIKYESDEQWKSILVKSNDIRILAHKNDFGIILDDYQYCYVGCHDKDGNELYRKDLSKNEFYNLLQHDWIDYRMIFLGDGDPKTYTLWPYSESKGWMDKIVKKVDKYG